MNPELKKHISRTIVGIRRKAPFYAYLATTRKYLEDPSCETCWTDGISIGINPDFALGLSADEFRTVLVHELEHIRKGDPWRLRIWLAGRLHATAQVTSADRSRWNKASDHSINNRLRRAGFTPVDGWLCDLQFDGWATEAIVPFMEPDPEPPQAGGSQEAPGAAGDPSESDEGQGQGEGEGAGEEGSEGAEGAEGDGDGEGGEQGGDESKGSEGDANSGGQGTTSDTDKPNPCGECRPAPGSADEAEKELRARKHDCRNALTYAEGTGILDSALRDEVKAMLRPSVDYEELLAIFMHQWLQDDEDWSKPQQDYINYDVVIPTEEEPAIGEVIFYVDTSGSMDRKAFEEVAGHVSSICHDLQARLHVIYVDNAVRGYQVFDEAPDVEELEVAGGGGTSFRPGFQFAEAKQIDPACAIYFTDLCCSRFPEREPDYPVLWVQWGTKKTSQADLPFGELVKREEA
jgi:predicted metal-dependent peptidase